MAQAVTGATGLALLERDEADLDNEFVLDVRVIEAALPVPGLLTSTSNGCGSTCSGTACPSFVGDPA